MLKPDAPLLYSILPEQEHLNFRSEIIIEIIIWSGKIQFMNIKGKHTVQGVLIESIVFITILNIHCHCKNYFIYLLKKFSIT